MDVLLFTVTAAAYCCLYEFGQRRKKPPQKPFGAHADRDCNNNNTRGGCAISPPPPPPPPPPNPDCDDCRSRRVKGQNPLPHRVQDWIHKFPHLQSSTTLLNFTDITASPTATSYLSSDSADDSQQQQPQPRVVGLIIDSGSNSNPSAPLLLEMAVAKANLQKNGASQADFLKIVYIASDYTDSTTRKDYYNPVAFGLVPFTTERFSFRRLLRFWVNTVTELVMGRSKRSSSRNDDGETSNEDTTSLKLVHSVTGKVLTKEGLQHLLAVAEASNHHNSNNKTHAAAVANPQDNWIEIL